MFNVLINNIYKYLRYGKKKIVLKNFKKKLTYNVIAGYKTIGTGFLQKKGRDFFRIQVPQFKKLRFEGKGYYIYKSVRGTIAPKFGFAHRAYYYNYFLPIFFLSKTKLLVFGVSLESVRLSSLKLRAARPRNVYTGRGVRFFREVRYKKSGKVSTYK